MRIPACHGVPGCRERGKRMSISATIILSAMRAVKKTGIIKGPGMDADINLRRAREYNRKHPYKEPSDRKAVYRTIYAGGYPCLVIRKRHTPPSGKAILKHRITHCTRWIWTSITHRRRMSFTRRKPARLLRTRLKTAMCATVPEGKYTCTGSPA